MAKMKDVSGLELAFGNDKANPFDLVMLPDNEGGFALALDFSEHTVWIDGQEYESPDSACAVPLTEVLDEYLEQGYDLAEDAKDLLNLAHWLRDYADRLTRAVHVAQIAEQALTGGREAV